MLKSFRALIGCKLQGRDGGIGTVIDCCLDDRHWLIRYFLVDATDWLPDRNVLISSAVIDGRRSKQKLFSADITRRQIVDSPGIDAHQAVSREHEQQLALHYGWPAYWAKAHPFAPTPVYLDLDGEENNESTLRSLNAMRGYRISAEDGEIGRIDDFLIEQESWSVRYFVAQTDVLDQSRRVVIGIAWISAFSWVDGRVEVQLPTEAIKKGPAYSEPWVPGSTEQQTRSRELKEEG